MFLIQSSVKGCEYLRKRLDIHLAKMRAKVAQLSDEEFNTNVGAVITTMSEKDKN